MVHSSIRGKRGVICFGHLHGLRHGFGGSFQRLSNSRSIEAMVETVDGGLYKAEWVMMHFWRSVALEARYFDFGWQLQSWILATSSTSSHNSEFIYNLVQASTEAFNVL